MENQNQTPQGWKDVAIVPDMPLTAMVQFFNILNQRLCTVEDNIFIKDDQGNMISLTKLYAQQVEEEANAHDQELRERAE